jgi:fatty-acyl-CoA synthase
MLAKAQDRLVAAGVLLRRGMVDPVRPDQALRAFRAMRRYGAFGGLTAYTAARYGDAPAITDEDGTITFRQLDETSNALARGLAAKGIQAGGVIAVLHRNHRRVMVALSAANKLGVRAVLMNTGFAGPQLADVSARERVGCILADDEFADLLDVLPEKNGADHRQPALPAHRQPAPGPAACSAAAGRHGVVDQRNHRDSKRSSA